MAVLFLVFLDQICPKWIKLDQIGFLTNLKNVTIQHIYLTNIYYIMAIINNCTRMGLIDASCMKLINLNVQIPNKYLMHPD